MATYKQIQNFVQEHHCVNVQTCWIAHMKEKLKKSTFVQSKNTLNLSSCTSNC